MSNRETVREKPILFSAEMVRAIIAGRKSQSRRVVKPDHVEGIELFDDDKFGFMHAPDCGGYCDYACAAAGEVVDGHIGWTPWGSNPNHWGRLWVREAFDIVDDPAAYHVDDGPRELGTGYECADAIRRGPNGERWVVDYRADGPHTRMMDKAGQRRWKPSIHMPRWASRLTLEIKAVRVERLHDMRGADVAAEGFPFSSDLDQFKFLWKKLNGKTYPWESNPFCWVISFVPLAVPGEGEGNHA